MTDYDNWLIIELWVCPHESYKSGHGVSLMLELIATAFRLAVEENRSPTSELIPMKVWGLRMVKHIRKLERARYRRDRLRSAASGGLQMASPLATVFQCLGRG